MCKKIELSRLVTRTFEILQRTVIHKTFKCNNVTTFRIVIIFNSDDCCP